MPLNLMASKVKSKKYDTVKTVTDLLISFADLSSIL